MTSTRDWLEWHRPYDDPSSDLSRRLAGVQGHLRRALDRVPRGQIRVVSMCAGQGHDLLGVLADHPRRDDVRARLVEMDPRNATAARSSIGRLGVADIEVVEADAGASDAYAGAVPAHVVLACGVLGNVADDDIRVTISALGSLCAAGATVIWTRHRLAPDATPWIRDHFASCGFTEVAFDAPDDTVYGIGVHRLHVAPSAFEPDRRLFDFVGFDELHPPPGQ